MKRVILNRYYSDAYVTLGVLKVLDVRHEPIFTLEKPYHGNMKDISCIPSGEYACTPFSGTKYKDVFEILNVPNRTAILFHVGNYTIDTNGCILLGEGVSLSGHNYMITNSTRAFKRFKDIIGNDKYFNLSINYIN